MTTILGVGILTWCRCERQTDRYGSVWLMNDGHTSMSGDDPEEMLDLTAIKAVCGLEGRLIARVISPRESTHIGDWARGLFPSSPNEGEEIELGVGTAFSEAQSFVDHVIGLKPDDGRDTDWLSPERLYRAHEQLVELRFEPSDRLN